MVLQRTELSMWGLILAVVPFLISPMASAGPFSTPKVGQMSEQAEIIVKATVSEVTQVREGQNSLSSDPTIRSFFFEAELQPLYALKGTVGLAPMKVSYEMGTVSLPIEYLVKGATYLVFLKPSGDGYALVSPARSKILADPRCPNVQPQGATVEDRLHGEFGGALDSADPAVVEAALTALGELGLSKDEAGLAARFIYSPDKVLAGCALVTLLKSGHFEYLGDAVAYMGTYPKTSSKEFGYAAKIGVVVRLITDPEVAVRLIGSMDSPNLLVRQSATYALRRAKVRAAVPLFVKGLEDADFDIRYNCLMGLAETVEGKLIPEWAPGTEHFAKDEGKYIRAWQDWWEKEGKEKTWK